MSYQSEDIFEKLSNKYNIPREVIKTMCHHEFKVVKESMSDNKLPNIRLKYFGLFKASQIRKKKAYETELKKFKEGKPLTTKKMYEEFKQLQEQGLL